jgi:hypothetical protein
MSIFLRVRSSECTVNGCAFKDWLGENKTGEALVSRHNPA